MAYFLKRNKVLKNALGFILAVFMTVVSGSVSQAEDRRSLKLNQGTVGLLASQPELIDDAIQIANAVDHTDGLRVLPIVGRGGLQSLNDLLFLRGVDAAMLSSDSLAYVKKNQLYTIEADRISYLAKLANENIIILTRTEFANLESLDGKRIATGNVNSDEFVAADLIFDDFGLTYERIPLSGSNAVAALKDGRIDAAILAGGASYQILAAIKSKSGLHILPISLGKGLTEAYSPAIISSSDLPNLIPEGTVVETVAAALVLAVFDWPNRSERFYKLRKFNAALFKNYLASLSKEQKTNFSATVPGWKPYPTEKDVIGSNPQSSTTIQ